LNLAVKGSIPIKRYFQQHNGLRNRQGRDLADKTTRCQNRCWMQNPENAAERLHLSGGRGFGWHFYLAGWATQNIPTLLLRS